MRAVDESGNVFFEECGPSGPNVSLAEVDLSWRQFIAWWRFRSRVGPWRSPAGEPEAGEGESLLYRDDVGRPLIEVREFVEDDGIAVGEVSAAEGAGGNWLRWRVRARTAERFLGFGERFNAVDQTGNRLSVWTEEGAFGLGETLGPLLDGAPWNPFPHGPTTAYKPIPFFISSAGYGLLLETTARVDYDVAATDPETLEILVWDRSFGWVLFRGATPAEVLERYTGRTGRANPPAPWVFAPWNDAVGGSREVRRVARKLRSEKIPTTAIWSEDWQGGFWIPPSRKRGFFYSIFPFRIRVDRCLYPDLEAVARELHGDGFRWLSYFMPYLLRGSPEYREAKSRGYLLAKPGGGVAHLTVLWSLYGHIDLTNEEARDWYTGFLRKNLALGFDGWMADFGEYVPPGSVTSSGEPGLLHHNRFPLLWQRLHRDFFDRERPDGDYVFFCRSAAAGSQACVPVFWSGDSNEDFERYDGLPSNVPATISAGLSGLPFWAADIGGYVALMRIRDRELFYRWTQFASMFPVMRTQHGTSPRSSWAFDSDDDTLDMFAKYARLHISLFPYIYGLATDAALTGLPAVRHLVLHYPDDPRSWSTEDEFLLGDRLLAAPVTERNARSREVYFPPGAWVDYWTGDVCHGPRARVVRSPLGHLPLFVREGSVLPTLDEPIDTLAPVERGSGLVGFEEAVSTIRITLYGTGEDQTVLSDGTQIHMWRAPAADLDAISAARIETCDGLPMDQAVDRLQPCGDRARPLALATARGDPIEVLLLDGAGYRLAGATLTSGSCRSRVTFEWR
ncbi:MAG: hypothetical protein KKF41_03365 [Actinobacteria bacterium]|nr:hypothetical protein [Actinomycetota bacterium]MBU2686605.1 hypothetical protein [Actinomycetota bacterium]